MPSSCILLSSKFSIFGRGWFQLKHTISKHCVVPIRSWANLRYLWLCYWSHDIGKKSSKLIFTCCIFSQFLYAVCCSSLTNQEDLDRNWKGQFSKLYFTKCGVECLLIYLTKDGCGLGENGQALYPAKIIVLVSDLLPITMLGKCSYMHFPLKYK